MTPDEYWTERKRLGAALRDLYWERRAIRTMFQGASGYMLVAGVTWMTRIYTEQRRLCDEIRDLDLCYHSGENR